MTQQRILELAYFTALNNWARAHDHKEAFPGDEVTAERERIAWNELTEICRMETALKSEAN